MKIMIIDCDEYDKKSKHIPGLHGYDRTLCGIAYEGMGNSKSHNPIIKNGKPDCKYCIEIVEYCKRINL